MKKVVRESVQILHKEIWGTISPQNGQIKEPPIIQGLESRLRTREQSQVQGEEAETRARAKHHYPCPQHAQHYPEG